MEMHAGQQQVDECSVWSHALLVQKKLALENWEFLNATTQTIPGGLLELDALKTLTVVRRDPLAMAEKRLQLWPQRHCIAHKIHVDYDATYNPDRFRTPHDHCPDDAVPIPSWVESLLRLGQRWLLRLYAHTPIAHWLDTNAAACVQENIALTDCRASWTLFAAPPGYEHEYSLTVRGVLPSSAQVTICIRIEPERARISVKDMQICDTIRQDGSLESCTSGKQSSPAIQYELLQTLASFAVHRKSYILNVHEAFQGKSDSHGSPPTLTPRRNTELYALEQRWYRQQGFSRGLF